MKMKLKARQPKPRSKMEMKLAMMEIWEEIEVKTRQDLILSFKERCRMCARNKNKEGLFAF